MSWAGTGAWDMDRMGREKDMAKRRTGKEERKKKTGRAP